MKVWVLADSRNGYFHTLQVYTGKDGSAEKKLGQRVVKDLTRLLKGKNHHVFFDNFFTSEELLQDLVEDGIFACAGPEQHNFMWYGFGDGVRQTRTTRLLKNHNNLYTCTLIQLLLQNKNIYLHY